MFTLVFLALWTMNVNLQIKSNLDLLDFSKTLFFWSKKQSCLFRISKKDLFLLNLAKKTYVIKKFDFLTKTMIKSWLFWPKPWTNPFENFLFLVSNAFFFIQNFQKRFFCGLICPKNKDNKEIEFSTKTVD